MNEQPSSMSSFERHVGEVEGNRERSRRVARHIRDIHLLMGERERAGVESGEPQ